MKMFEAQILGTAGNIRCPGGDGHREFRRGAEFSSCPGTVPGEKVQCILCIVFLDVFLILTDGLCVWLFVVILRGVF